LASSHGGTIQGFYISVLSLFFLWKNKSILFYFKAELLSCLRALNPSPSLLASTKFFLKKYIQINLDLVTFKKCYRMEEYRIDDVHCFMLGGRFELIASIWNAKINDNVQLNTFNVDYLLSFIFELFQSCVCFRQSNI